MATIPAAEQQHVLDADGHFHVDDAPIDLSHYVIEDWLSLGFFWLLGLCVFYQFFTRYVLNNSAAWTEEIARYLLMSTVFVGIAAAVRRTRHIHVDFLYRLLPARAGRALSTAVDIGRIAFFAVAVALTIQMMTRMGALQMTIIDLPMNLIYGICGFGFAAATLRSVQVAIENWRRGFSLLERPEHAIEETIE
jgi:TRAP-type C4-dicarboxylate transport system permease small subunit